MQLEKFLKKKKLKTKNTSLLKSNLFILKLQSQSVIKVISAHSLIDISKSKNLLNTIWIYLFFFFFFLNFILFLNLKHCISLSLKKLVNTNISVSAFLFFFENLHFLWKFFLPVLVFLNCLFLLLLFFPQQ